MSIVETQIDVSTIFGLDISIKNDGSYLIQAKKLVGVYIMSSFVTFLLVLVPQDIASHAN